MPEEFSQDEIDKILEDALGGPTPSFTDESDSFKKGHAPGGATSAEMPSVQSQADVDSLLADALSGETAQDGEDVEGSGSSPATSEESETVEETEPGGPQSQDDIDALLADVMGSDSDNGDTSAPAPEQKAAPGEASGPQSQDDIDSLLAGALGGGEEEASPGGEAAPAMDADDIDSLLAGAIGEDGETPSAAGADDVELSGALPVTEEDDIEALLAGAGEPAKEDESLPSSFDETEDPGASLANAGSDDIDALLSGALGAEAEEDETPAPAAEKEDKQKTVVVERKAPPPPPPAPEAEEEETPSSLADELASAFASDDLPDGLELTEEMSPLPVRDEEEDVLRSAAPPLVPKAAKRAPAGPPEIDLPTIKESLSLVESGTEIESITGDIAGLLGHLSERARRYQHAWQTANQQASDAKNRLRAEERRTSLLQSEKTSLVEEVAELRSRLTALTGEHAAAVEEYESRVAGLEVQVRERDKKLRQAENDIRALHQEVDEAHKGMTQSDVEMRRAQFELERIRNDLEAERQERARLQRALDTRERELQAAQAQSVGQASSLFLDELHRLIRRLESELDLRSGAARDALAAVERLQGPAATSPEIQRVRQQLLTASGIQGSVDEGALDGIDDLRSLSRQGGSRLGASREAAREMSQSDLATLDEFALDLRALEMDGARLKAMRMLNERSASPAMLMDRVHSVESLRTPRVASQLAGLVSLLRLLHEAQRKADVARGREGQEAERVYIQLFDLLHHLVRGKVVTKATPDAWEFFFEIRGRFSFITSDAEWYSYRDKHMV